MPHFTVYVCFNYNRYCTEYVYLFKHFQSLSYYNQATEHFVLNCIGIVLDLY